jgi:dolichol-phosphate mannosyltransferase
MSRILVSVATYNEIDNVEKLSRQIFDQLPDARILFVDDASPDGTGRLLDELSKKHDIHVIHRPGKMGLGTASLLAFKYALAENFDYLISMDADFSHDPKHLPEMVKLLRDHEFVLGSRWMKGGVCDYKFGRKILSITANQLSRFLLGLSFHEVTTYYRGYDVRLLRKMDLDSVNAEGYSFAVELIYRITRITDKIVEFPIYFRDRQEGVSKISKTEVYKGAITLFKLFIGRLLFAPCQQTRVQCAENKRPPACPLCKSLFHKEMYPEKRNLDKPDDISAYRCSSQQHSSHGRILRCLQCSFVFSEINITAEKLLKTYSAVEDPLYISEINARYKTYEYNLNNIKPYLPPSGTLLDIGSYCGAFLRVARQNGFSESGVEPTKWAVRYSQEVMKENTFQGTLVDLPLASGNFDIITLWDVLEHMPNPLDELDLIWSRLNPKGIFCFSTIMIDNWYASILKERWPWIMDMHLLYFSKKTITQLLAKKRFELLHSRTYCHYVSLGYFLYKLDSLNIFGMKYLIRLVKNTPLNQMLIPFSFGDIQLFVCRKAD